ncbi:MFS transporter [Rhodococcus sp. G-MC3]|uniref:MFS transporter n=1 Tax=Rhodococcus sp. G-MC3 TaxID=3046209 RepID=UPI0024BA923B|nr:MFS transporter [Rhodococcus sp. G-MC3]MDJ0394245.1 MFS transporter [Rhodococcus sp. G-MC3]
MTLAAFVVTAVFVISNSPTPLYVYWQQRIGFGSGTLTIIFAAYILGLLLTLLIAGQLSDHFGRRHVLLPGLVSALAASALFLMADDVAVLIVARLLTGISVGVIVSAGMASVVDAGGDTHRAIAARLASVAMVLGAGLGPLFAGFLAQYLDDPVSWVFGIESALIVLAAAVVYFRTQSHVHEGVERSPFQLRLPNVPHELRRYVLFGIAVFGPGITATSFVLSLGPSLLARQLGVTSPLVAGGTACAMFLVATGVQFAVARVAVRTIFIGGAASTALSMVALFGAVQLDTAALLIVSALLAGAGQGLGQLGGLTLIGIHVPSTSRAQGNALMNIGGYVPAGLLPLVAGYLIDATSIPTAVTIFSVILFAAAAAGGVAVAKTIGTNEVRQ